MSEASFWNVFVPMIGAVAAVVVMLGVSAVLVWRDGLRNKSRD